MISINACTVDRAKAQPVTVGANLPSRSASLVLTGLPSATIRETGERARAGIIAGGFTFPRQRVEVSLAPADLRKDSTALDLPIAAAILAADGQIKIPEGALFWGQVSLKGELRPVRGVLAAAEHCAQRGLVLVCPADQAGVARQSGAKVIGIHELRELRLLSDPTDLKIMTTGGVPGWWITLAPCPKLLSPAQLPIAEQAAQHPGPVLLRGRSALFLARHVLECMPPISQPDIAEVMRIHEAAGLLDWRAAHHAEGRPFRAPHHTISAAHLMGGLTSTPGELDLSRHGVLCIDDIAEWPRNRLELVAHELPPSVKLILTEVPTETPIMAERAAKAVAIFPNTLTLECP